MITDEHRGETAPLSAEAFDDLYRGIRRWGAWEDADRGAYNLLTPAHTARAARLATAGEVVPMALPWATEPDVDNPRPALHHMTDLGDREAPEPSTNKDFIGIDYHGKSSTHLDALAHIAYRGELFDGRESRSVVGATGARFGAVSALGPFVGRGVLLDLPVVAGRSWLEAGEAVYADDLLEAERVLGVEMGEADAVLVRTGHKARRTDLGAWDPSDLSAGLHATAMPVLADRGISLLGSDGDSDVRPSPVPGVHSPVHILALTALGIPLLDNLDLEAVSQAAARHGRYEFLFAVLPLNVPGGTGSPVTPTAVF